MADATKDSRPEDMKATPSAGNQAAANQTSAGQTQTPTKSPSTPTPTSPRPSPPSTPTPSSPGPSPKTPSSTSGPVQEQRISPSSRPDQAAQPSGEPQPSQIELDKRRRSQSDDDKREESQTAKQGAQAVADAVSKFAQSLVNDVSRIPTSVEQGDFIITGSIGGRFRIDGPARSFGTSGTVLFDGVQADTYGWGANHIEGKVPAEVRGHAEVIVQVDSETQLKGFFRG